MTKEEIVVALSNTTDGDVLAALEDAYVELPIQTRAALLEAFHRILDQRLGEGFAGDD